MPKDSTVDLTLSAATAALAVAGLFSTFCTIRSLGWIVIGLTDLYLIFALVIAAHRSGQAAPIQSPWYTWLFPTRVAALLVVLFLLIAAISGFAAQYVGTNVFAASKSPVEAFYISFLTLGFSDFTPASDAGRLVVIAELTTGVLLLIGAFPLVISRISTFR